MRNLFPLVRHLPKSSADNELTVAPRYTADLMSDSDREPDIVIGHYRTGYNVEFSGMSWSVPPPDHDMGMSSMDENDRVSIASHEATYGGDRATLFMLDDDERLRLYCQAELASRQ